MTIEILNGGHGREINAGIMASALLQHCTLHGNNPFVRFDVPDWEWFLKMVYHTYGEFSKSWRGKYISERISVTVYMMDGRIFHTQVWYDVENRCLRYVSLY